MKFIKVNKSWYVRGDLIRDVWLSGEDKSRVNIAYVIAGMTPDHMDCNNGNEARQIFDDVIRQLNSPTVLDD